MIKIHGRFATYGELWLDEEPPLDLQVDVLTFRLRPQRLDAKSGSVFLTLVNDLTGDDPIKMVGFRNTSRYQIKRAESKDGLSHEFITKPLAHLDEFCAFYDEFAKQKQLPGSYRRSLDAACDAGRLVLSAAVCNGQRLVWHAHIVSCGTAVLLHSASHFRMKHSDRALVGRANRWLHWRDMREFKQMKLSRYDWGGIFADEEVPAQASVNDFKREFGGREHRAYTCVIAPTLKGRAYLTALSLMRQVKRVCRME